MNFPKPRSSSRVVVAMILPLALAGGGASAQETLPVLPVFKSKGAVLDVTMTTKIQDVTLPQQVPGADPQQTIRNVNTLEVACNAKSPNCDDSEKGQDSTVYGGAVLELAANDELKIKAVNGIDGNSPSMMTGCMSGSVEPWPDVAKGWVPEDNKFNLHTHGLLTSPYTSNVGGTVTLGDNIFDCIKKKGDTLQYDTVLGTKAGFEFPGSEQPSGVNWFHPHVHGIAKAQVSSGMAGMIVVTGKVYSYHGGAEIQFSKTRNILLKDIQIVEPDADSNFVAFANEDPNFCGDNKLSADNIGFCNYDGAKTADLSGPAEGISAAIFGTKTNSNEPSAYLPQGAGRWLFTLNGAVHPTIVVNPAQGSDHRELWRVQNASANITYRLTLLPKGGAYAGPYHDGPFEVMSFDGAAAAGPTGGAGVAPLVQEVVLMPGARAELAAGRPLGVDFNGTSDQEYELVSQAFQAGFAPDSADTWPRVSLASVIFKPVASGTTYRSISIASSEPVAPDMAQRSQIPKMQALKGLTAQGITRAAPSGPAYQQAKLQELCADHSMIMPVNGKDPVFNIQSMVRRIYFGIGEHDKEDFLLGETFYDEGNNVEYDTSHNVIPKDGDIRMETFDAKTGFCALKAASKDNAETWELINISPEVHNFHIHQLKFTVKRDTNATDPNANIEMRTPSDLDRITLLDKLALASGEVQLEHDTIIVPRGTDECDMKVPANAPPLEWVSTDPMTMTTVYTFHRGQRKTCTGTGKDSDQSGMLRVDIAFAGDQFKSYAPDTGKPDDLAPASFVFHCHILEHEDNGMMARMSVIDPAEKLNVTTASK